MAWIGSCLSLITLVETIPEAQFSTWHLGLSFCLVLLVKQVWNCHQHPVQFTLPCCPWPRHLESWGPAVKPQIFILPKSHQCVALVKRKRKASQYRRHDHPICEPSIPGHFSFSASKRDYVFYNGMTPVLWTELSDHVMWLNSLKLSLCSLWHQ